MEIIPGWLTISEAMDYADLSNSLLAKRLREKRITGVQVGKTWLIEKASLDAYIASERKPGVQRGTKRKPKPKPDPGPVADTWNAFQVPA
jgi:excisionase family DNA binding protein